MSENLETLINEFKTHNKELSDRAVEYYEDIPGCLFIVLDDNSLFFYDSETRTVHKCETFGDGLSEYDFKKDFSFRLRRLIKSKGFTQDSISSKAWINKSTIASYMYGTTLPNIYVFNKLACALDCQIEDLMFNDPRNRK